MRTEEEVNLFRASLVERYGDDARVEFYTNCYEACIPKTFWDVASDSIQYNRQVFEQRVLKYTAKMKKVLRRGYSLLFTGDNGAGKTIFMSFILTQAMRRGRSAYYTTLSQLDSDIKRGFKDTQADRRLQYLLEADFIAIDEIGKEHYKADSWLNAQLEQLLKRRYDDGEPVLMATNLSYEAVLVMYGVSIASMLEGRYTKVPLEAGDYRKNSHDRMRADLGFNSK